MRIEPREMQRQANAERVFRTQHRHLGSHSRRHRIADI